MWYMSLDSNNRPNGWSTEAEAGYIQVTATVRLIHEQHPDYIYDGTTLVAPPVPTIPPPTNAEIIAAITRDLEAYYDTVAQRRRYDNRLTCALRAGYPGPFQTEGQTFAVWMDNCNAYAYQVMADVQAGKRGIPTSSQLIAEFPAAPFGA